MEDLSIYSLTKNPIETFNVWLNEAIKVEQNAQAMSVATYDFTHKRPSSRYNLLKGIQNNKFVFYTN